jgi:hypothetical protein
MRICRTPNCARPATTDLGFCAADHARYLKTRTLYTELTDAVLASYPSMFASVDLAHRRALAESVVAHAADGVRGFSDTHVLRGEILAVYDTLDEIAEHNAARRRATLLIPRARGTRALFKLNGPRR